MKSRTRKAVTFLLGLSLVYISSGCATDIRPVVAANSTESGGVGVKAGIVAGGD